MVLLQECQAEVTRENRHLANMGSERLIKEHRVSAESGQLAESQLLINTTEQINADSLTRRRVMEIWIDPIGG